MSQVYTINKNQIIAKASDTFIAVIDGEAILAMDDFYEAISKALNFPDYFGENMDALDEMLYDLDWIEHDYILLMIKNSDKMLQHEIAKKESIIALFEGIDNPYFEVCLL